MLECLKVLALKLETEKVELLLLGSSFFLILT